MTTPAPAPKVRYLGVTDEQITCDKCGKDELKKTVILVLLDADGNDDAVVHYGTTCAARALALGRGGARKVADAAAAAHRKTVDNARWAREVLAWYQIDADTGEVLHPHGLMGVHMDYEVKHRDNHYYRLHPQRPAQWRAQCDEFIAHHRKAIADAKLIGA